MTVDLATVDQHLRAGELTRSIALLRRAFEAQPTLANARAVISRLEKAPTPAPRRQYRVWCLRSYTIEPLFPLLRAGALLEGLDLEFRAGDFNTYAQELLDPASALYEYRPDIVLLAVQTRDLLPELWTLAGEASAGELASRAQQRVAELAQWIGTLRTRCAANVVVFDFDQPAQASDGTLDSQQPAGQSSIIASMNQKLREFSASTQGVFVLGFNALVARTGRERFYDERKWLTARMPFAASSLWLMARECLRVLLPLTGMVRKAIVVDLDNTLWGGVVGEDGPTGIALGIDYPGAAFLAVQRVLLDFHRRGIILALASKNNAADALEVLEKHPAMLLRPHHFAAMQLHWNAKSESLRAIAAELNIGTDSLVFVDDNPAERAEVGWELPEVLVVDLPADPMGYAAALRELPVLERVRVAAEDRDRGRQYAEQRERSALKLAAGTVEDYYRSLEMQVQVQPMAPSSLARVSQLTQKTNQFNLSTRRYDEARMASMAADAKWRVYSCSVLDRFGDNGLVGVAIVHDQGVTHEIDTMLLSCRVIGRTVETAMLSRLADDARAAGAHRLRGWFIPTAKNEPAAGFFAAHGFERIEERDGAGLWELDLMKSNVVWPEWLTRAAASGSA